MIYASVGVDGRVLAEYTAHTGNFMTIAAQILPRCEKNKPQTMFSAGGHVFYVLNKEVITLVMCDANYSQRIAFDFLQKVRSKFLDTCKGWVNAPANGCMEFAPTLRSFLQVYSKPEDVDKIARLTKETQEVSDIISEDMRKVVRRGEKIQVLVKKTELAASLSIDLRDNSRTLKHQMTWNNWKVRIIICLVVFVIVYFILVLSCGGFALSQCF